MLADRIRSMRSLHWIALFGGVLLAWIVLYAMAVPADLRDASKVFGAQFWSDLCNVTPDLAGFGKLILMWALMSTAMMLPTTLPALAAYDDLANSGAQTNPFLLIAGFLLVWWGFSLLAAALQMALFKADLVSAFGDSRSQLLSAALLTLAGAYQFSTFKESCLAKCRAPLSFYLQHWDDGPLKMGLRLGASCVGCCWALMALAFVGGVMSLAFMGLATFVMIVEKLPDLGRWISRPLGGALLVAAGSVALTGI